VSDDEIVLGELWGKLPRDETRTSSPLEKLGSLIGHLRGRAISLPPGPALEEA